MNKYPLVSIVIPTRHRIKFLKKALKSIYEQSYKKIQIIVHDNNTPNLSLNEINPDNDPRIEFYKSNEDLGLLENWKKAISYAKGDLFLRFDDDNVLNKSYIENVVKLFVSNNLRMVTGNCLITQNDKSINSLFPVNDRIRGLSRRQLTYLTYQNLIDTNFSVYDFRFLIDSFGIDGIYETNLPDRYLDLRLANIVNDEEIIFIESIAGISRNDYRVPEFNNKLGESKFDEITALRYGQMEPQISPHNNFTLSRFHVFLEYYKMGYANKNHYFSKIISLSFLEMELLIGNLRQFKGNLREFFVYYIKFILYLLKDPDAYYQNKRNFIIIFYVTKVFTKSLIKLFLLDKFDQKKDFYLSYWADRLDSLNFDEFIRLYSPEAVPLLTKRHRHEIFISK